MDISIETYAPILSRAMPMYAQAKWSSNGPPNLGSRCSGQRCCHFNSRLAASCCSMRPRPKAQRRLQPHFPQYSSSAFGSPLARNTPNSHPPTVTTSSCFRGAFEGGAGRYPAASSASAAVLGCAAIGPSVELCPLSRFLGDNCWTPPSVFSTGGEAAYKQIEACTHNFKMAS